VVNTPWDTAEPLTAFDPDQSPDAVHDVGELVALQVRAGLTTLTIPLVGLAVIVTTGTASVAETVTLVQPPQLLPSFDSVMAPAMEVLLSAQTLTEYVPADAKVYEYVAVLVEPLASAGIGLGDAK
jgi:hypothetical protein